MGRDVLEKHLVAELKTLEDFRQRHDKRHPSGRVEREDPDVRRLIEAMGFFSVRTRLATIRNVQATWRRLFGAYFGYLLDPLPSKLLVSAQVTPRMVESTVLEAGSELRITAPSGQVGYFRTTSELRIVPVTLESLQLIPLRGGTRLVLNLRSRFPRTDAVGLLRILIQYIDHYDAALRVHYQLRAHTRRAFAVYEDVVTDESDGPDCLLSYGSVFQEPHQPDTRNPLLKVRSFFHFPQEELFVNLDVPRSRKPWSRVAICLDLDDDWPRDPVPTADMFQLFAVPAENLRKESSEPIPCDGTQEAYPIRYHNPSLGYSLQSTLGVYRIDPEGMTPLQPGILQSSDAQLAYEVEERIDDLYNGRFLIVRMPGALMNPVRLVLEGLWHQPGFAREAVGKLKINLPHRNQEGLLFQPLSDVKPHAETALGQDAMALLRLLAMRMKSVLDTRELHQLLHVLGTVASSPFQDLPQRIKHLSVELAPDSAMRGSGLRHVYKLTMDRFEPDEEALVWMFLQQVRELLDTWNSDATVELSVDAGGSKFRMPLHPAEGSSLR